MEVNYEYLIYLENRLRLREKSRSYRWTLPARLVWNIFHPRTRSNFEEEFDATYKERFQHCERDFDLIRNSGYFDAEFACPWHAENPEEALLDYLDRWKRFRGLRKPSPGFHPGIYAQEISVGSENPFAHYIRAGMPDGPWSFPVITAEDMPQNPKNLNTKVALHIHLYYTEQLDSILDRLLVNHKTPDLLVSVRSEEDKDLVQRKLALVKQGKVIIRSVPNRGRNFGSLFTEFRDLLPNYDLIGHVHTKKSPHLESRDEVQIWKNFLLENMIGGLFPMMDAIIAAMSNDDSLGLIFADDPYVFGWRNNTFHAMELARRMNIVNFKPFDHINFPAGSMFWTRPQALKPFLDLTPRWEDYPQEPIGDDGSMLHALERMIPSIIQHAGFRVAVTHVKGTRR